MRVARRRTGYETKFLLCLLAAMVLTLVAGGPCCGSTPPPCAESAKTPQQKRAVKGAGKGELLYVTLSGNHWSGWAKNSPHRGKFLPDNKAPLMPRKISMVKVVNDKGIVSGRHVLPVYSGDLVVAGLMKKLGEAGYTVQVVRKLPAKGLGLDVSLISAQLEQSSWLFGWKGRCEMRVRLEMRQNGQSLESHVYAATGTGSSWNGQQLLSGLMAKAACDITSKAMADITPPPK